MNDTYALSMPFSAARIREVQPLHPQFLYRFFDEAGDLLYVGVTGTLEQRFRGHKKEKEWWHEVANITVTGCPDRETVLAWEAVAIHDEKPRYNRLRLVGTKVEAVRKSLNGDSAGKPSVLILGASVVGYARTDKGVDDLDGQIESLSAAGCSRVFLDEDNFGISLKRRGLNRLYDFAQEGDTVVVESLERLGSRGAVIATIVGNLHTRGVLLRVLDLGIDTSTPSGLLAAEALVRLADIEHRSLSNNVKDGLETARRNGQRLGRPSVLNVEQKDAAIRMYLEGITATQIAKTVGVSVRTVRRLAANYKIEQEAAQAAETA